MPQAEVAVCTQSATNVASFMVVVNRQFGWFATDNALWQIACFFCLCLVSNPIRITMVAFVLGSAVTAPTVQTAKFVFVQPEVD